MTVGDLMNMFADGIEQGLYGTDTPIAVVLECPCGQDCELKDLEDSPLANYVGTIDGRVILKAVIEAFDPELDPEKI